MCSVLGILQQYPCTSFRSYGFKTSLKSVLRSNKEIISLKLPNSRCLELLPRAEWPCSGLLSCYFSSPCQSPFFSNVVYLRMATSVVCVRLNQPSKLQPLNESSYVWKYVEIKCQLDATEVFIAELIFCSTCFGHHYAHHQELKSIIQWLLPVVFGAVKM